MSRTSARGRAEAPIRVAEYVRMSTEQQQYSTRNQSAAIAAYAAAHAMTVVKSYRDQGRSGLRLEGRHALQQLLQDVRTGQKDFDAVLVFDVSRWGRFQNADEAAYHEFVCLLGGVRVIYVAEPFSNDGSPFSAALKGLKRAMAGEYSRELSEKVYAGQSRLLKLGYRQGGVPGFGLRRMRIDEAGRELGLLERGQIKAVTTDRVILVPGPAAEVRIVRAIFRNFIAGVSMPEIARRLNAKSILNAQGKAWGKNHIREMLTNTKYIGENVYGRTHGKLHQPRTRAPQETWVTKKDAFKGIVSRRLFAAAKARFGSMAKEKSDEDVLSALRKIVAREGCISTRLIQADPDAGTIPALVRRFGSVRNVYSLIGYVPPRNLVYADIRFFLREVRERQTSDAAELFGRLGVEVARDGWRLSIDGAWSLSFTALRMLVYRQVERWYVRQNPEATDIVVFIRMSEDGTSIHDYVIWPRVMYGCFPKDVSSRVCAPVASYTVSSLAEVARALGYGPGADHEPRGDDALRIVVFSGRARAALRDADLVGWLARHHPSELAILQRLSECTGMHSLPQRPV